MTARSLSAGRLFWQNARSIWLRTRFKVAVPLRAERRDLRRRLRAAARDELAEQARVITKSLERLADRRAAVMAVTAAGPVCRNGTVEFIDGTRFVLRFPNGVRELVRLGRSLTGIAYLEHVEPSFGHCWYLLRFRSVWGASVEVSVKVVQVGWSVVAPARSLHLWWHRPDV